MLNLPSQAPRWILKEDPLNANRFMCHTICPRLFSCHFDLSFEEDRGKNVTADVNCVKTKLQSLHTLCHRLNQRWTGARRLLFPPPWSFYLPAILLWAEKTKRKRGSRGRVVWKSRRNKGSGSRDCRRKREWKPCENPYTWFIPARLCAVGRSYLLFMRASAAKRPDVKLCGDLI